MKISFFLLFVCTFQLLAMNLEAQNTIIDLPGKTLSVGQFINEIEKQTDYLVVFSSREVDTARKTSISNNSGEVSELLKQVFNDTDIIYEFEKNYIVLTKSKINKLPATLQQTNKRISGTITDENGEPIIGANVVEKGTTNGIITDLDGNFSLSVTENATLQISYIGYVAQEVRIGNQTTLSIQLKEDTQTLDEVVVVGYGSVKKKDLTGAVAALEGATIAERKSVRVSQALQGAIPGVMVTRSSGAADASATIRVRGVTTIGDSDPLVIIDGIPGTLDWVSPDDIENISVLKDAASASIYGSRAAAGVILVTTKRANKGELSLEYDFEYSFDKPTRRQRFADATTYMRLSNEQTWNDKFNQGTEYPLFSSELIDNYANLHASDPNKYPDVDWIGLYLNDYATKQNHRLSITGGGEKYSSKISIDYDNADAIYDGRNYQRYLFRANNDVTINKYLRASVDINGIHVVTKSPGHNYSFGADDRNAPIYAAFWSDGRVAPGLSGHNPVASSKYGGFSKGRGGSLGGKISVVFTPIEELSLTAVVAPEIYSNKNKNFSKKVGYTHYEDPENIAGYVRTSTNLSESRTDYYKVTWQFLGNYNKSIGRHNMNLMLGAENYYTSDESLGASRNNYQLNSFPYLNLGNSNYQYNNGSAYEYGYRSFFGRIMYNFNNKYLFQANARYDGSSRFAKDHRWGFFPSFSAGWAISEESFMKNIDWLSFLKLRASWGTLGNERIGSYYPYQSTIAFGNTLLYKGNNIESVQSAFVNKYAIEDISWETTESFDIGIDANFLNNRLTFSGDYYKKKTKDMLLNLEIPRYIGLDNPSQNSGKMSTTGWEFIMSWRDKLGDLFYSVSFNLSDFKSKMGDLGGTEFLGDQVKFEGSEFNEWYGYKTDGLFQTEEEVANSAVLNANIRPGDIKYLDISGPDGVPDGKISSEYDRVLLGGSLPRYMYGGNINLTYKNIDFGLTFQGVGQQNSMINKNWVRAYRGFPEIILGKFWSAYNTPEQNANAQYPKLNDYTIFDANNYSSASDFWRFNGAYFRLKNITLGYTIPKIYLEKCKIQNARIYASISDLFSIDNYPKDWDPEASGSWIMTSYMLGLSVKF